MISLEFGSHTELSEKKKNIHKELELLKKAVEKREQAEEVEQHIHLQMEISDLFIERKDRKRQISDNTFDISPGNHILFNLSKNNN